MYCKEITYTDYEDVTRTEKLYFNLNKAELMEMNVSESGGLDKKLQSIIDSKDPKSTIEVFKNIIIKAYGVKSPDGKRFTKTDEVKQEFLESEAYSEMFMLLATDADEAKKFINGIIPKDLAAQIASNNVATITSIN